MTLATGGESKQNLNTHKGFSVHLDQMYIPQEVAHVAAVLPQVQGNR
jgi:hypothetical protein